MYFTYSRIHVVTQHKHSIFLAKFTATACGSHTQQTHFIFTYSHSHIHRLLLLSTVELAIRSARQKRDVSHQTPDENILLVQSIQITDKFAFNGADASNGEPRDGLAKLQLELGNKSDTCINGYGKFSVPTSPPPSHDVCRQSLVKFISTNRVLSHHSTKVAQWHRESLVGRVSS